MGLVTIILIYLTTILVPVFAGPPQIYSVLSYGAKGDGKTDDSWAFLKTWKAACADSRNPYFVVSGRGGKRYLLSKVLFEGPCQSALKFLISGELVGENKVWTKEADTWITFKSIPRLTVLGDGLIDGRGSIWWDCKSKKKCSTAPYIMEFMGCNGLIVKDLNLKDSPGKHLVVYKSEHVILTGLKITAPENSPNTDGILISDSRFVVVSHSRIGVGDDCIAIGPRSYDISVSHIICGPGHGISIGSLGKNSAEDNVERINISNSHISNTLTGIRIKTWQGGAGYARFIYYKNINFTAVKGGIIVIDQHYCPGLNCPNKTGNVAVSGVSYTDLTGSSADDLAVKLVCSSSVPCRDITMTRVSFTSPQAGRGPTAYCANVQGREATDVSPSVPCLKRHLSGRWLESTDV